MALLIWVSLVDLSQVHPHRYLQSAVDRLGAALFSMGSAGTRPWDIRCTEEMAVLLETGVTQPQGKSHQQPPEAGRGQEHPCREWLCISTVAGRTIDKRLEEESEIPALPM